MSILHYKFKPLTILGILIICMFVFFSQSNSYFDELFASLCLGYLVILFSLNFKVIRKEDKLILVFLVIFFFIGIFSNIVSGISVTNVAIIFDAFSYGKIFFIYIATKYLFRSIDLKVLIKMISPLVKIFITISFVFGCINIIQDIGMSTEMRYGIRDFAFVFGYPGGLGLVIISLVSLLLIDGIKNSKITFIMSVVLLLFTTKMTIFIFPIVMVLLYLFFIFEDKIRMKHYIISAMVIIPLAWNNIKGYLLNSHSFQARNIFYRYSFELFEKYLPVGAGFSTFGGLGASKFYSPLYVTYQFYNYDGMSSEDSNYLNDAFLSGIFGQTGLLGTLTFFLLILATIKSVNVSNLQKMNKIVLLSLLLGSFVGMIGSAMLKTTPGCLVFFVAGLIASQDFHERKPTNESD